MPGLIPTYPQRHLFNKDGVLYMIEIVKLTDARQTPAARYYARVLRDVYPFKVSLFDGHCNLDYQPEPELARIHGEAIATREHADYMARLAELEAAR